jgi:hypothetical protein
MPIAAHADTVGACCDFYPNRSDRVTALLPIEWLQKLLGTFI